MKSANNPSSFGERTITLNLHTIILIALAVLLTNLVNYALTGKPNNVEFEYVDKGLPVNGLYLLELATPYLQDVVAFESAVKKVSGKLDVPPEWLMSVMYSESKFDAGIANHRGSGAVGLIQWMPATAKDFGTTTAEIRKMNHVQQLNYVYKYLNRVRTKYRDFETLTDLYLAILYPRALEGDFCYALYATPSTAYKQNSGLDENEDGIVTVKDIDSRMKRIFPTAYMLDKHGNSGHDRNLSFAGYK
ncbi:MAG: transglycosylase SLT domain-containing protein [Sphingobacteriales bacterium]|nr:MAG: transglycosylase SLT domain-containing protein [Sphingobacteriales bacterium]